MEIDPNLLELKRGTTEPLTFYFTSGGVAVNITGTTVYFAIKADPNLPDSRAILNKSWTSHSDPTNGVTTLTLTNSEMNIPEGEFYFEVKLKTGSVISGSNIGRVQIANDLVKLTN